LRVIYECDLKQLAMSSQKLYKYWKLTLFTIYSVFSCLFCCSWTKNRRK